MENNTQPVSGESESEGASPIGASDLAPALDPTTSTQAQKQAELIRLWGEIAAFLELVPTTRTLEAASSTVTLDAARERFQLLFEEEIQVVLAARNAVAHGRPIDEAVLDESVELARELARIIHEGEGMLITPPSATSGTT